MLGNINTSRNIYPSANNTYDLGLSSTRRWRAVQCQVSYRTTSTSISTIDEKENLIRLTNEHITPIYDEKVSEKLISVNNEMLGDVVKLFSKMNIYTYNYKNDEDKKIKIGVIIEEIISILGEDNPLVGFLVEEDEFPIIDENGVNTGVMGKEYQLRIDNLESLKTIFIQELWFRLSDVEKNIQRNKDIINNMQ